MVVRSIIISSGNSVIAGVDSGNGIYRSTDDGTNWSQVYSSYSVYSLFESGSKIFAGSGSGVLVSTNDGLSWNAIGLYSKVVRSVFVTGNFIVAGVLNEGIFYSTNSGQTWDQKINGLGNISVSSVSVSNNFVITGTIGSSAFVRPLTDFVTGIAPLSGLISSFELYQNYPNPFNPNTVISYSLPSASKIKLIVYNTLGQTVKLLENSYKQPGNYSVTFNASTLSSGIYFYKLEAGQFSQIKKMILLK
jgi:Secretion system C-terminal sorting domain